MRLLTIIVLVMSTLWGGYWFVGATALERAATGWFESEQARGGGARYADLSVAGFPNRFDLTVNGLHLESADRQIAWDAPFAEIYSLSYKPWHLIAALPNEQTITLGSDIVTVRSSALEGSLVVSPETSAALERITVIGRALMLTSDRFGSLGAADVSFATRRDEADPLTHELGLRVIDLAPDPAMLAGMLGDADLPPVIGMIRADASVTLTAPLDRFAGETRPSVTKVDLKSAEVTWGDLRLTGNGQIVAGADGLAEGRIVWSLKNWQAVPPALVAMGVIKPEIEPTVRQMMEMLASQSADPQVLDLPLIFQSGRASLGPLPLGPAPRMN